jgi:Family of unknown function (DUF6879)
VTPPLVSGQDFVDFVEGLQHTAFRLEVRDRYNQPREEEPFRRFLAGEPIGDWYDNWQKMLRRRTAEGQRISRVRIVTEPHTDYTRFGLFLASLSVPAGEDIRYLPRDRAKDLDLPDYDFWLIDSIKIGILRFGDDDIFLGAEIHDDPAVVVKHCYYRDVASHYAIPFAEYVGS